MPKPDHEDIFLHGERYHACVTQVRTKNPDGSPSLLRCIKDDQSVELADGDEFMVVYAPARMVCKPKEGG